MKRPIIERATAGRRPSRALPEFVALARRRLGDYRPEDFLAAEARRRELATLEATCRNWAAAGGAR